MRSISFLALVAMTFTASAGGYRHKQKYAVPQGYIGQPTVQGYIGQPIDPRDLQNGNYVVTGYGNYDNQNVYVPAPPDYSNQVTQRPNYPQYNDMPSVDTYQPPAQNPDDVFQQAWDGSGGTCNTRENPHSYGCTLWNFNGNGTFPWFPMDWSRLRGPWFTVVYVRNPNLGAIDCSSGIQIPDDENRDCEFSMRKNPDRPTQPMGVENTYNHKLVKQMIIDKWGNVSWNNWLGKHVQSDAGSVIQRDPYTMQFQWHETTSNGAQYVHNFTCRDFNRNSNHHLLCKWDMWFPGTDHWVEKGFLGFLTQEVWDGFFQQVQ